MQKIYLLLLAVQDRYETSPDQLGRLGSVDTGPDPGLSVVIYDGAGLLDLHGIGNSKLA